MLGHNIKEHEYKKRENTALMLYFIACHAPDFHGAKVADGLARVTLPKTSPHLGFASKELAQYYLDCRNANKLCYIVSEEALTDTLWFDFKHGVLLFNSIKEIRKALKDIEFILTLPTVPYTPVMPRRAAFA